MPATHLPTESAIGGVPQHVAIIMDGNGRWAQSRNLPRVMGHRKGVESVRVIVQEAVRQHIRVLTLYAFSDENWGRPKAEVAALFSLLRSYITKEVQTLHKNNIRLQLIGDLGLLPEKTRQAVEKARLVLAENTGMVLTIALSYGARSELTRAVRLLAKQVQGGTLAPEDITPESIQANLWTAGLPDPDLFIRTSGELRLSNFLLWQIAYTELWFSPVYWPDFRESHFLEAIAAYQQRKRRYGLLDPV